MAPTGIALIGGGLWAKEEHIPAISACPNLSLKAIYSRSLNSARATASCIPSDGNDATPKPDLYANDAGPGYTYSDLLGRQDIQAVVVCLPIMDGPQFIEEALTAGKHVLAEKPIAPSVERAVKLIEFYEAVRAEKQPHVTFAIAENFRVLPALERAVDESRALGKLTGFRANVFFMLDPSNRFLGTEWRKKPAHQGGFVFDAGTHFVAPVRAVLGSDAVESLMAYTAQVQEFLPPLDTVHAVLKTKTGVIGAFSMAVGTRMSGVDWSFSFEKGSVTMTTTKVTVTSVGDDGKLETTVEEFERTSGVSEEITAWAESLASGKPNPLLSPHEGLADLEFLENMFKSGEQQGAAQAMKHQ